MLAVIAAVIFFLVAFGVHIGTVNLLALGLAALALHFVFAWTPWAHRT